VSLTQRLLAGSLLVVGILTALVVVLADRRLEDRLRGDTIDDLGREARLIAAQWRPGANADSMADTSGRWLQRRVTVIDDGGHVVGDTDFDRDALVRLQNHNTRPEVIAARRSGMGWSRRSSASAGDEELYVAVRAPLGVVRVSMSTRALAEAIGGAQRDVLVAAGIAMLVATALTLLFAQQVSRPIIALRDVARSIAAGNLQRRAQLSAAGEVGDLADALAEMADQLAARLGAIEAEDALLTALFESLSEGVLAVSADGRVMRLNESARSLLGVRDAAPFDATRLPRDRALREVLTNAQQGEAEEPVESTILGRTLAITARPMRHGGAVVTLFDLSPFRRLELVRRDFVANVSHELRTPLTVIRGFAETLGDSDDVPEQERRFAATIRAHTVRMQRIVDDLLDLSRIESGGWVPAPHVVDVAGIARDVLASARPDVGDKPLTLVCDVDEAPRAYADPTALRQVLTNLVSNAVRHTQSGSVTVLTRRVPGAVAVGVRDTGSGIAAEHLPRIFERFYRVDPGRSRDQGGTGLGLSIVRHLTEAHGGHVSVESTVGVGTTLLAHFPEPSGIDRGRAETDESPT
jgi:signal transduction histidine kinase/HAMP domain-containing protein